MVAKSFQNFIQIGEPFLSNGKMYVQMQNPKTKTVRTCRWYSDPISNVQENPNEKSQKEVLGFSLGYVTLLRPPNDDYENYFRRSNARYARYWGWYIISTEDIPADLPKEISTIKLPWEIVGDDKGNLNSEQEVKNAIAALTNPNNVNSQSSYLGTIGERRLFTVTVTNIVKTQTQYGITRSYIFQDDNNNVLFWNTKTSPAININDKIILKGTVKEHNIYNNTKQTILTRCAIQEVK